jgi:hypothetical protein
MRISCYDFLREMREIERGRVPSYCKHLGKTNFLQRLKSRNCFGIFAQSYALKIGAESAKGEVQMSH